MAYSRFGNRVTRLTGAKELMDDMGEALASSDAVAMLGGGNPARIPAVEKRYREELAKIAADPDRFARMAGTYAPPVGEQRFRRTLAALFNERFDWGVTADNIALTSGSQNAFFMVFNMLAGDMPDGTIKKILLPLAPEYIGYSAVGLSDDLFVSNRPTIELLDDNLFKYFVDFDAISVDEHTGAICVSRPTNPTGNVLTDEEVAKLSALAEKNNVPFIVDNAYGAPFPNILAKEVQPVWNENTVLCMSLSKIGLPGVRSGIIIANETMIESISAMNALMHLSVGSVGPVLVERMIESGELLELSKNVIAPFYRRRAADAVDWVRECMDGLDFRVHVPEGAIFLWLWFPGLPITAEELYRRLKNLGVLVIAGQHFFPGLADDWRHRDECIRITFAQQPEAVRRGIAIIADVVRAATD